MRLFVLLRSETRINPRALASQTAIGAASTVGVLGLVSFSAVMADHSDPGLRMLAMLAVAVLLNAVSQNAVMSASAREAERIIRRLRARLFDRIQYADYMTVSSAGRAVLFTAMAQETQTLSRTVPILTLAAQQVVTLVMVAAFLAYLSLPAFLAAAVFGSLAVLVHVRRSGTMATAMGETIAEEQRLFQAFEHFVDGYKEVRINQRLSDALSDEIVAHSDRVRAARSATKRRWAIDFVIIQSLFYALVGLMTFAVPMFDDGFSDVVLQVTTVALFMIGPISTIAQAIPAVAETDASLGRILAVEEALSSAASAGAAEETRPLDEPTRKIALSGATFTYRTTDGAPGFALGPVDLDIRAGEITFITGGNGAGKTTLLRLLAGLLVPDRGALLVNGEPLQPDQRQAYRDGISAVLSDYHLFRRLYGVEEPAAERLASLLDSLEIADKVAVRDRSFSTIDLSSGQRKRLALLVAELEDKPVLMLDEWAADQDPSFRRKFYEEILPGLKRPDRIVLCVTHDDRYFHVADRVIQMDEGHLSRASTG